MEKLSFRIIVFLCCAHSVFAQDTLFVYKAKGTSLLEIETHKSAIKKGDLIQKTAIVNLLPNAQITTIDNTGNVYLIDIAGTYSFKNILNFKEINRKTNFTADYFKYIWTELRNKKNGKTLIAGVFRGTTLMRFPLDSSKIASSKITLKWDVIENENRYHVFIKNTKTGDIDHFETNGSQLALFNDNPIFNEGNNFKWTVTTDAFPNLKNIPFYSFQRIDRNDYEGLKLTFKDFINDLKAIGLKDIEITKILCETYGICK